MTATPAILVDGVAATSIVYQTTRGIGGPSTLSVSNQGGTFSRIMWLLREAPEGAGVVFGVVGASPAFAVSTGDLPIPGRYLIQCIPDDEASASGWVDMTVKPFPVVGQTIPVGAGQAAALGNVAAVNATGPQNTAQYGWRKEIGPDGVASWTPLWR